VLQETEEATRVKPLQALQEKFAKAAQIKFGSKEKRVSWSCKESEFGPQSPDDNMAITPPNCTPTVLARGSKYRWASNLDNLMAQLNEQVCLSASASAFATSFQKQDAAAELEHASEGEKLPNLFPPVPIKGARGVGSPSGIASPVQGSALVRSSLFCDLATLCQEATVHASSVDLVSGIYLITTMGALALDHISALNATNYLSIPHNQLPEKKVEDMVQGTSMFLLSHRTTPGSRGHFWFRQVGIKYLEDQDSKTTMLLGLSSLMDILPNAIDGFDLHPLDKNSTLPALTNNRVKDGFPGSVVLAFKYFLVKDKHNRSTGQQTVAPPSQPSSYWHNEEGDYKQLTALWSVICVTGNGNMKEACEALAWDMVNTGLQVQWKDHPLAESSTQVLLINVPPVLDRGGIKGEIIWHLTEIEKGLLKKGVLPSEYVGIQLPKMRVSWQQNKQGKGKNKVEMDLSLNKLPAFQESGCLVCMVL
jgi:hypothetical protein